MLYPFYLSNKAGLREPGAKWVTDWLMSSPVATWFQRSPTRQQLMNDT